MKKKKFSLDFEEIRETAFPAKVEPLRATTSRKRPPNQNLDAGSSVSQIVISETSRKRPLKPGIKGGSTV